MNKLVTLGWVLLVFAIGVQAQSGNTAADAGKTASKAANLMTITGCLQTPAGQYTLIEDNGTPHQLSGGARKLKPHVGHEVEITGKPGIRTYDTTQPGAASSAVEEKVFEVQSVKHIADTCKSAGL
ncbi:MAG: hypothetical protein P4M04_04995 [Acidobacteriota bacterium]|nr:hypothetical protein [Acidobacteriota bacterium]